jgi:hypothetical protein
MFLLLNGFEPPHRVTSNKGWRTEQARQNQLLLLPPDSLNGLLLREQLHHHLIVIVHCGNSTNTLQAGRLCGGGGDFYSR